MWWPYVAEGNIPLTASKGKEISMYKELDPTTRLLLLKALCELRADQDDIVSYINDEIKGGTQISQFRKDNIGYDDKGITYWCDGSTVIGYRLYKEVTKFEKCRKGKGKGSSTIPRLFCYQWETLACNLEEFREVVDKFSSSENNVEVAVSESVKGDAISALENIQKKKERALQKKERQEMLLSGLPNLIRAGQTRSCRSRNPVSYTYENYDQAIKDAIQVIQKRKTSEDKRRPEVACRAGSDADINLGESSTARANGQENDTYMQEKLEGDLNDGDDSDDDYDEKADDTHAEIDLACSSKEHKRQKTLASLRKYHVATKPFGTRWSTRLAGNGSQDAVEMQNMGAKNRLRQRPTRNTALESTVVPVSDDDGSPENPGIPDSDDEGSPENPTIPDSDDEGSPENPIIPDSDDEGSPENQNIPDSDNEGSPQNPNSGTSIPTAVVPDSDDEGSSENPHSGISSP